MLIKFEGFDIKDFFALGSEAVAVNFLVILFVPQARIFKEALLIDSEALISIGLIPFLNTPSNQIKLLIFSRTFSLS